MVYNQTKHLKICFGEFNKRGGENMNKEKRIEDFIRLVKTANTQQQALVLAFEKGIEVGCTVKESA